MFIVIGLLGLLVNKEEINVTVTKNILSLLS